MKVLDRNGVELKVGTRVESEWGTPEIEAIGTPANPTLPLPIPLYLCIRSGTTTTRWVRWARLAPDGSYSCPDLLAQPENSQRNGEPEVTR